MIEPQIIYADTFLKRLKGLIKANQGSILILPNCRTIHTFSMQNPIQIYFLNTQGKILKKITNLPPKRIAIGPKHTHTIIEIL